MKNLFKVLFVAAATTVLFSCAKETPIQDEIPVTEKTVQFTTTPITKTVFGTASGSTLPTLWTDSYSVGLSLNYAAAKKSTAPVVSGDGATASFEATIADDESGDYTFIAVSPYDQLVSLNSGYTSVNFNVPTAQEPSATSPDEKAQILVAKYDAGSSFPSSVTLDFQHITAYGKIGFSNLSLADGETVASVSLTASENWAGRFYYYVEDHDPYEAGDVSENSASSTITITTNRTTDIWFGCAPVDLGGKNVDVVITTNTGTTYSKTITIPAGKKFTSGVVNAFTINMSGITADGAVIYTLVKDVADLTLGCEVIIVADEYDYALSTTQNTNNRGQASVTKSVMSSADVVASPGVDVQVLTIANGNKAGTYAFSTDSGYLYAVSGNNYLRTKNTLANDGSWMISVNSSGVATIKSIGTTDTRLLKYNNSSSIFSCYTSGQKEVRIYKRNGTGSGAIDPKEPESLSITGATTTYSVDDTFEFDGTVTLVYSDTSEEVLTSSDYTVDDSDVDMTTADTYTVTIKYNDDDTITGSYDITVSGGGSGGSSSTAEFSYTDFSGQGTSGSGSSISATKSTITVASDKGYGADAHVRIYSGGKITVSAPSGKNITSIVFTSTASGTANNGPSKISTTTGSYSYSGNTGTWTGSANSIQFSANAQFRFTAIVVTYN